MRTGRNAALFDKVKREVNIRSPPRELAPLVDAGSPVVK
jgi:hypothetical protein